MISGAVLLVPLFAVILLLEKGPSVRWNESTVWIHGVKFDRTRIRRVALRPLNGDVVLEIRRDGSRWSRCFVRESVWMAGVLETLGYGIEFSEKGI